MPLNHREISNALEQLQLNEEARDSQEELLKDLEDRYKDEIRDLREKNSELAQEVQHMKLATAQKDKERLELLKENNELRLKLSRLRSASAALDRKFTTEKKDNNEQILGHLVQASGLFARNMELDKRYMSDRQQLETEAPVWVAGGAGAERVRRVPPLLIGGQSIQPVVALRRTMVNNTSRTDNQENNNHPPRASAPNRLLQDVYIPLTRIDMPELNNNVIDMEDDEPLNDNDNPENSAEDLDQNVPENRPVNNGSHISVYEDAMDDESRNPEAVMEVVMEVNEDELGTSTLSRSHSSINGQAADNPLEGPSWLLNEPGEPSGAHQQLEADSTTGCHWPQAGEQADFPQRQASPILSVRPRPPVRGAPPSPRAFSPTVRRRRKRNITPPRCSPKPIIDDSRELRVVITDFVLDSGGAPAKRGRRMSVDCTTRSPVISYTPEGPMGRVSRRRSSVAGSVAGSVARNVAESVAAGPSQPSPPSPRFLRRKLHASSPQPSESSFEGYPAHHGQIIPEASGQLLRDPDYIPDGMQRSSCSVEPIDTVEPGGSGINRRAHRSRTMSHEDHDSARSHSNDANVMLGDVTHTKAKSRDKRNKSRRNVDSDGERRSNDIEGTHPNSHTEVEANCSGSNTLEVGSESRKARVARRQSCCDDSDATTRRRQRKPVVYKEIPLNRKMRR